MINELTKYLRIHGEGSTNCDQLGSKEEQKGVQLGGTLLLDTNG
jgi:hypothetical protein